MVELRRSSRVAANKREPVSEQDEAPPAKKAKGKTATSNKKGLQQDLKEELSYEKDDAKGEVKDQVSDTAEMDVKKEQVKELKEGDEIPDLTLKNQEDEQISLRKVAEENRIVIIFAYPKASTPGCTRQACGYRDNYEELKKHAAVFGLSTDAPKAQKAFKTKQNLPFDLICDPKRILIGYLGAKKTAQSGTIRSHWIFLDGKLKSKHVKVSPEVSVEEGKKEVLELAAEIE